MITDPVADAFTRIRNAQRAGHHTVTVRGSKLIGRILDVLAREGFIEGHEDKKDEGVAAQLFNVRLRYTQKGTPAISRIDRVSGPGRRIYRRLPDLPRVQRGLGVALLTTSQGVMSDREARRAKIGGEVIAYVS